MESQHTNRGHRFRFAPSPTGALHIGGARTALYNWLLARGSGGALVLRIEDTDRERSTPENVEQILDALHCLELDWDEGPLSQYERRDRHREVLSELVEGGQAYYDPSTAADVRAWKEAHGGAGYRGEPREEEGAAIRLRVPDEGETVVDDVIRGPVHFENRTQDDFVIARGDGTPLYNLAVAVDDADMGITDVVRGDDHLSNTPKQLLVLQALGSDPPRYAHLPLLHCAERRQALQARGRRLGPGASRRRLPAGGRAQLPGPPGLGDRGRHDPPLDRGAGRALLDRPGRALAGRLRRPQAPLDERPLHARAAARGVREAPRRASARPRSEGDAEAFDAAPPERRRTACAIVQDKAQTLDEAWPLIRFLFRDPVDDPRAWEKVMKPEARATLSAAADALRGAGAFDADALEGLLGDVVERLGAKPKNVYQPIRVAITGTTVSPGIFDSLAALGRDESVRRIDAAIERLGD